ncbi:DUF4328 domain-containing protein [Sphingobium sp. CR28]|uniref:DUF4328 domain-containing protein n=1 Tax=Sphingobium sp. CR28 TaxID=3400272 RepID=UPI003FED69A2
MTLILALFFVCDVLFTASEVHMVTVIDRFLANAADISDLEAADSFNGITAIFLTLGYLASAVAVCMWIVRVNRNAQTFDQEGVMTISPRWNVGYFFVPFANLLMPFRGIAQTYQVSADPHAPSSVEIPLFMRIWWGAFLISGVLGNISFRLSMRAETLEEFRRVAIINIVGFFPEMIAVATLAWLIRTVTAYQQHNLIAPDADAPVETLPLT